MAASARIARRKSTVRKRRKSFLDKVLDDESAEELLNEELQTDAEPEEILRRIQFQKEIIASVKSRPWPMKKKIRVLKKAREFVEKYEGRLSKTKSYTAIGKEIWKKANLYYDEITEVLTPWDKRIKTVESYFGSSVASYFTFLRWLVSINLVMGVMYLAFIVLPEAINGTDADYKKLPPSKLRKAWDLETLWTLGGHLEYSVLFYGHYSSDEVIGNGYRLPLAYFVVGIAAFAYSFIALLRKMARNSRADGGSDSSDDYTFSWKLFCSWDYMIANSETAENKSAAIATAFRESIVEEQEKEKKMDNRKTLLIFLRIVANILVMLLLAGSLYSIQNAVSRGQSNNDDDREKSFWEQNEVGVVVTLVTLIAPSLFEVIGTMEKYHPRSTLRIQLARILMLYLGNLYSLMIGLLHYVTAATEKKAVAPTVMNVTFDYTTALAYDLSVSEPGMHKRSVYNASIPFRNIFEIIKDRERQHRIHLLNSSKAVTTATISTEANNIELYPTPTSPVQTSSTECWETFVGQELLKLTIIDLISTVLTVLIIDFIRALIVRYLNFCCCWDLERQFPEYGEFKIAENVLHLIYNQGVTWIGSFFCPLLPVINVAKLTILMYLRSWAVVTCNVPHTRVFRASGSNFYLAMLLFMLFLSLLPTMWVIMQCPPSDCGPFRNKERMYAVLSETLEDAPDWLGTAIGHMSTPVVIIPVVLLLGMVIYYLQAVSSSSKEHNSDLRSQLQYERKEGRRNIFKLGAGTKKPTENKSQEGEVSGTANTSQCKDTQLRNQDRESQASKSRVPMSLGDRKPSVASSILTVATDMELGNQRTNRPKALPRQRAKPGITYESLKRKHLAENRAHRRGFYTDTTSSCASPTRDCYRSPFSSRDHASSGCDYAHCSPYTLRPPNLMLNAPGLYHSIPRYSFASLDGSARPTLLLQPTQVPNVPCIIMPTAVASQSAETETHHTQGEKVLYAQYDPVTGTVGNIVQDDAPACSEGSDAGRLTPHRCQRSANRRRSSFGLVRQGNVKVATSQREVKKESSCDTTDVFTSDGEYAAQLHSREGRLPSYDSGRCSEMLKSESLTDN